VSDANRLINTALWRGDLPLLASETV